MKPVRMVATGLGASLKSSSKKHIGAGSQANGNGDPVRRIEFVRILAARITNVGLSFSFVIEGAHLEGVLPGARNMPVIAPRIPGEGRRLRSQRGSLPSGTGRGAEFDFGDFSFSRPSDAFDPIGFRTDFLAIGRAQEFGIHQHASNGSTLAVRLKGYVMLLLEITLESLAGEFNAREPLHGIHAIPSGNKSAKRKAVISGQGRAIHLVSEQRGGVHSSFERDRASEVSVRRYVLSSAGVRSVQNDGSCRGFRPRLLEHVR